MSLDKIPATVVTGMLGSGKTTLLRHLIGQLPDRRLAVIVNEFGALDIDTELLRGEDSKACGAQLYELPNGCICCTVEEDFLPVMRNLLARDEPPEQILIETSGLALPKPLVQAFNWPDLQRQCTVDAVVAVVDGAGLADEPDAAHAKSIKELYEDQLAGADLVVINKTDLLNADELKALEKKIRTLLRPGVSIVTARHGELPAAVLSGLGFAAEAAIEQIATHHDSHHEEGRHHRHAHEDFDSVCLEFEFADEDIEARIGELIQQHSLLRVKGFLALKNKPMRQVFQAVGPRIVRYFDRAWRADETPRSRLVFIGQGLESEALRRALQRN